MKENACGTPQRMAKDATLLFGWIGPATDQGRQSPLGNADADREGALGTRRQKNRGLQHDSHTTFRSHVLIIRCIVIFKKVIE
jgi:hypothetical protein